MRKNRKTFPPVAPYIERLVEEHVDDPEEFIRLVRRSNLSVPAMIDLAIEAGRDPLSVAKELGGAL